MRTGCFRQPETIIQKYVFPNEKHLEEVVNSVYEKIVAAEIWIPYGEVFKHYRSKRSDINKRVRKSLNETSGAGQRKCAL